MLDVVVVGSKLAGICRCVDVQSSKPEASDSRAPSTRNLDLAMGSTVLKDWPSTDKTSSLTSLTLTCFKLQVPLPCPRDNLKINSASWPGWKVFLVQLVKKLNSFDDIQKQKACEIVILWSRKGKTCLNLLWRWGQWSTLTGVACRRVCVLEDPFPVNTWKLSEYSISAEYLDPEAKLKDEGSLLGRATVKGKECKPIWSRARCFVTGTVKQIKTDWRKWGWEMGKIVGIPVLTVLPFLASQSISWSSTTVASVFGSLPESNPLESL